MWYMGIILLEFMKVILYAGNKDWGIDFRIILVSQDGYMTI